MRKSKITLNAYQFQKLRETKTTKQIALMIGCSQRALQSWCYRRGIEMTRLTEWELQEEIYNKTPKEIAYEYNMSLASVYYKLKKIGLNTKGGAR